MNRIAVFLFSHFPALAVTNAEHSSIAAAAIACDDRTSALRAVVEVEGNIARWQGETAAIAARTPQWRWRAEMRGVRYVGAASSSIASNVAASGGELGEPGEDRPIPDLAVDDEGRALRDLQRVKLRGARPGPRFHFGRTRALQQFVCVETARLRADLRRDFPIARLLSLAHRRRHQRQPDPIIGNAKIPRGFRDQIRRQAFLQVRLKPARLSMKGERIIIPLRR